MKSFTALINEEMDDENGPLFDETGFSEQLEGYVQYVVIPALYNSFGDLTNELVNELARMLNGQPSPPSEYTDRLQALIKDVFIPKLFERIGVSPNHALFKQALGYIALSLLS